MISPRVSPETEETKALEAHSLRFAQHIIEIKDSYDDSEKLALSAFGKEKEELQSRLQQLQDRLQQLQDKFENDARQRQRDYRARLQAAWDSLLQKPGNESSSFSQRRQSSGSRSPPSVAAIPPSQSSEPTVAQDTAAQVSEIDEPPERDARPILRNRKRTATDPMPRQSSLRKRSRRGDDIHPSEAPRGRIQAETMTIAFKEVFRGGLAKQKHFIIDFPKGSGTWYILKCDKHKAYFKINPLLGAARHLQGHEHGIAVRSDELSIKLLGYRVQHCNAESVEENNRVFRQAQQNSTQSSDETWTDRVSRAKKKNGVGDQNAPTGAHQHEVNRFYGVTNPIAGRIYRGLWKTTKAWYAVLVLPTDSFDAAGLSGGLTDTRLVNNIPRCYRYHQKTNKILGWETSFDDGGPNATKRRFPVMFFADDEDLLPGTHVDHLPTRISFGWLGAQCLRPLDFSGSEPDKVIGLKSAQQFWEKLQTLSLSQSASVNQNDTNLEEETATQADVAHQGAAISRQESEPVVQSPGSSHHSEVLEDHHDRTESRNEHSPGSSHHSEVLEDHDDHIEPRNEHIATSPSNTTVRVNGLASAGENAELKSDMFALATPHDSTEVPGREMASESEDDRVSNPAILVGIATAAVNHQRQAQDGQSRLAHGEESEQHLNHAQQIDLSSSGPGFTLVKQSSPLSVGERLRSNEHRIYPRHNYSPVGAPQVPNDRMYSESVWPSLSSEHPPTSYFPQTGSEAIIALDGRAVYESTHSVESRATFDLNAPCRSPEASPPQRTRQHWISIVNGQGAASTPSASETTGLDRVASTPVLPAFTAYTQQSEATQSSEDNGIGRDFAPLVAEFNLENAAASVASQNRNSRYYSIRDISGRTEMPTSSGLDAVGGTHRDCEAPEAVWGSVYHSGPYNGSS